MPLLSSESSEKATATATPSMMGGATPLSGGTTPAASSSVATPGTPRIADPEEFFGGGMRWQEAHGGIIGAAVQNLRARSIKRKAARSPSTSSSPQPRATEHLYEEPVNTVTKVKFKDELKQEQEKPPETVSALRRSVATSTPALVVRIEADSEAEPKAVQDMEMTERQLAMPLKPPRRKSSRSTSPASVYGECSGMDEAVDAETTVSSGHTRIVPETNQRSKQKLYESATEIAVDFR